MSRAIWKGAISFGLVHVPVSLHSAVSSHDIDFDWLDERTMDRVGYKRVNKRTGREVDRRHIVRGFEHRKGRYVVVTDEDLLAANVKASRTIELSTFVEAAEVSFMMLETPYYLEPEERGAKVYALLREALARSGRIGIGTFVLHARQHLAALIARDRLLVLHRLRWANEVRPVDDLSVPPAGIRASGIRSEELRMAQQLIEASTSRFDPAAFRDTYQDDLRRLIERKIRTGRVEATDEPADSPSTGAEVIDLSELLRRSLNPSAAHRPRSVGSRRPGARKSTAAAGRRKS